LYSVIAFAPDDIWAGGLKYPATPSEYWSALLFHWDGSTWSRMPPPPGHGNAESRLPLAGTSSQDLWAVSDKLYHWNGTDWQTASTASASGYQLNSFVFRNSNDGWAAGTVNKVVNRVTPGITHWDGGQWTPFATTGLPDYNLISSFVTLGSSDLWVAGSFGTARWDGAKWRVIALPGPDASFNGRVVLAAHAPGDLWAAAGKQLYRWSGKAWERIGGPTDTGYEAFAIEGPGDVWAGGSELSGGGSPTSSSYSYNTRLVHIFSPCDVPTARVADPHQSGVVYAAPTGHTIRGPFLTRWELYGNLSQFGYPITEEYQERNTTDGGTYTVQYFQRGRFEYHPENAPPYDVLLGLLGRTVTAGREAEAPFQPVAGLPDGNPTDRYFPQTRHAMDWRFIEYWDDHGGLPVFGYPISEPFTEVSPTDGKPYLVQYFERNRLEYHPELLNDPYRVSLGLLGANLLQTRGWLP
jgi:hypothetical protein